MVLNGIKHRVFFQPQSPWVPVSNLDQVIFVLLQLDIYPFKVAVNQESDFLTSRTLIQY